MREQGPASPKSCLLGLWGQGLAVQEIANMIERMRADDDFQEHYKTEKEEATEEEIIAAKKKPANNQRVKK